MRKSAPKFGALLIALPLLASCVSVAVPTPTPSPTVAPTPTPSPTTSPSPTPSPAPSPTPTRSPSQSGDQVIAAFLREFGVAQPPFHVETDIVGTGTVGPDDVRVQVFVGGDVVGENFDGQVQVRGEAPTEVMFVDGTAYGRQAGGEWISIPDYVQTQPLNPFSLLDESDLEYVGPDEIDGQMLHQLRTEKWIGDVLEAPGLKNLELESTVFDIFVDDGGLPVWAELVFTITGETVVGLDARISYDAWYGFTNVGDDITIEPPI